MKPNKGMLDHVAPVLKVSDLARSTAIYRDRLGFELEFDFEGFYASVVREGCRIHLNCSPPVARDLQAFEAGEHRDACFVVKGAAELCAELEANGADFSVRLRSQPYGQEFYVCDPDGYILGLVEPA